MTSDSAVSAVADVTRKLLAKSEAILLVHSLSQIQGGDSSYYLHPNLEVINHSQSEAVNQWWGHVSWWTDGATVAFYIQKFYGGSLIPLGLPQDWF